MLVNGFSGSCYRAQADMASILAKSLTSKTPVGRSVLNLALPVNTTRE